MRGWSGAAASAFRERHAELSTRWARAAAAFRSAAQAWERFGIELVAAQELAAAACASAAGLLGGGRSGLGGGMADHDRSAARMLAEARARRDRAADAAAREIAAAAALAPNPPGDGERRALAAADWVRANGVALGHVARGVGEGVEDLVRLARLVNPADPYNLNHPGRFLANASTALAGAVDDVVHPLRQVAGFVGPGWGSDPARAYGHLLPTALLTAVTGAGRSAGRAPGSRPAPAALRAAAPAGAPLWADPRPTARPFAPAPPPPAACTSATCGASRSGDPPSPGPAAPGPPAVDAAPSAPAAPIRRLLRLAAAPPAPAAGPAPGWWPPPASPRRLLSPAARHPAARTGGGRGGGRRGRGRAAGGDRASPAVRSGEADAQGRRGAGPAPRPRTRPPRARDQGRQGLHQHAGQPGQPQVPPRRARAPRAANPAGAASVVEHVVGRRSRTKDDSPYSSFTAPGARAAVDFGGSVIEVDIVRLQADIDAGRLTDVEILPPHRVQAAIQADADRIAGRPVDLYVRKGRIPDAARSYGLDAEATAALRQRMIDMANAQRHHEWMIRGVVPNRYIIGPHPGRSHG